LKRAAARRIASARDTRPIVRVWHFHARDVDYFRFVAAEEDEERERERKKNIIITSIGLGKLRRLPLRASPNGSSVFKPQRIIHDVIVQRKILRGDATLFD